MHPGEAKPFRLPRVRAANDNRRRARWRRAVAAAVAASFALMMVSLGFHASFALMMVSLGFHRYAHHLPYGASHPAGFLAPN